jgi:hypothetical protein
MKKRRITTKEINNMRKLMQKVGRERLTEEGKKK